MNEMDEPFANDPEYRARKTRLRAELVERQMNRDELIDLLAHNLTCYELLSACTWQIRSCRAA